jgi:hypothetical protein
MNIITLIYEYFDDGLEFNKLYSANNSLLISLIYYTFIVVNKNLIINHIIELFS